ncbi:excalibur calcium-binding domain-containing protein [Nocardia sp. NPDC051900]|uniref:excalibur calcium-binding domain-containing protein n=1 Tax=Nocardia sp. NPDC051900 TaxID=3364326 RepID=UPI00378BFD4A
MLCGHESCEDEPAERPYPVRLSKAVRTTRPAPPQTPPQPSNPPAPNNPPPPNNLPPQAPPGPYYKNCTEVRNAGKAPPRRGQPGYAPHLDRDNDGIACE